MYNLTPEPQKSALIVISQVGDYRVQVTITLTSTQMRDEPTPEQAAGKCHLQSLNHVQYTPNICALLALFRGHRRNGLATSASSNCIRMQCHGNCNISFKQFSACDTFFQLWEWAFLLMESTVCSQFFYWSEVEVIRTKIVMQSAYTSAIERLLLKWNGRDCDCSMNYAVGFYCCHVTAFWNLIGTANYQVAEVALWGCGSCQAVSPTAWERG